MTYREDIDGLRAVAILLIVFFHAELQNVPGGFIGVDVFFVISGYLISTILLKDISTGSFSFRKFYQRRLRRLGPALLTTLLLTLITAWFLATPDSLKATSEATIAALFSVSNFYFYATAGYFDLSAYQKPLLHTWSLAVEEQFYLIWPALLFLLFGRLSKPALSISLLLVGTATLFAAEKYLATAPDRVFFLAPFRVYEFALGALIAITGAQARGRVMTNAVGLMGIILVIYAGINYTDRTPFPGVAALIPCVGTMMVIYAGPSAFANRVLGAGPFRYIGQISYSLYLVHWPVQVFYRFLNGRPHTPQEIIYVFGLTFLLAVASYYLIETPFRKKDGGRHKVSNNYLNWVCILIFLLLCTASALIIRSNGAPGRYPAEITALLSDRAQAIDDRPNLVRSELCQIHEGEYTVNPQTCAPLDRNDYIVVVGDSHAHGFYIGLRANYPDAAIIHLSSLGCLIVSRGPQDRLCAQYLQYAHNWIDENENLISAIIVTQSARAMIDTGFGGKRVPNWSALSTFSDRIDHMVPEAIPVFFIGPRHEFDPDIERAIILSKTRDDVRAFYDDATYPVEEAIDDWLMAHFAQTRTQYISSARILCNPNCPVLTDDDHVFVFDYGHWSLAGATIAVFEIVNALPRLTAILSDI
ncbi:hypothetical protein DS901_05925 [Loktanella sp. D2R18]|uniref:acyltransferase family protein n=1 Tax=Rhodobacterales TaxID=204455 RepID=UPI000DE83822|nr:MULTISPECIES: acyltransferase family protein [Rhodobacterales]MDO6590601.1 acyltransferase family protein [Yoonia sp. 1_MG-2023]RBW44767.1 hypothetical protein DS901_05925 [Loktanella sp. D2R18]